MIGTPHPHLSLPMLAASAVIGLAEPGCSPQVTTSGAGLAHGGPTYERYIDLRPTVVASCMDDNPNPPAGCM
jgi:hypothetical protein